MNWKDVRQDITSLGVGTFGQDDITFTPGNGDTPTTIRGIFDRAWVEIALGNQMPVSGMYPVLDVDLSELPSYPVNTDKVTVDGQEYKIIDCRADGAGGARLILRKA